MEMRLLDIGHKDIFVIYEISLTGLEKIKRSLDLCKIEYDGTDPKDRDSVKFLTGEFYSAIEETIDRVKGK
jgi:hypothetical protein